VKHLHTKFKEERAQVKKDKEKFLTEKLRVKEAVNIALRSMIGLEQKAKELVEHQLA
jgi:hypothetical protein